MGVSAIGTGKRCVSQRQLYFVHRSDGKSCAACSRRVRIAGRDIIFRAIAGLALIIVAAIFAAHDRQDCSETQPANSTGPQQKNCEEWWIRFFIRTVDDPITFFTLVLAASTVGLWIVTWRSEAIQGRHTLKSLSISRRMAKAAQESADIARSALRDVERPYIIVEAIRIIERKIIGFGSGEERSLVTYEFDLKNFGRTPAIVRFVNLAGIGPLGHRPHGGSCFPIILGPISR